MLTTRLQDPSLLAELAYVDGQWIAADSGATLDIHDPATGHLLARVPAMDATDTRRANGPGPPGALARPPNARRCWSAGTRRCSTTSTTSR